MQTDLTFFDYLYFLPIPTSLFPPSLNTKGFAELPSKPKEGKREWQLLGVELLQDAHWGRNSVSLHP